VYEVKEVLRHWLRGEGLRAIASDVRRRSQDRPALCGSRSRRRCGAPGLVFDVLGRGGTKVNFDHQDWDELCSLRFLDAGHNVMIMGPPSRHGQGLRAGDRTPSGRLHARVLEP
jgi:hypothetical protein